MEADDLPLSIDLVPDIRFEGFDSRDALAWDIGFVVDEVGTDRDGVARQNLDDDV